MVSEIDYEPRYSSRPSLLVQCLPSLELISVKFWPLRSSQGCGNAENPRQFSANEGFHFRKNNLKQTPHGGGNLFGAPKVLLVDVVPTR